MCAAEIRYLPAPMSQTILEKSYWRQVLHTACIVDSGYVSYVVLSVAAERRGLSRGDEYLFALDYWGRSQACQSLADLGMKAERTTVRCVSHALIIFSVAI